MFADFDRERAKLKDLTDEQLMLRVQEGHTASFDLLVVRYKDRLFNYLLRLVGNRDDAEEIAQEALVKAYIHAGKYKTIAKFSTWLYTIATNLVRNRMRSRSRAPQIFSLWSKRGSEGDEEKLIDIETETPEFSAWRWAEMAELPDIIVPFKRRIYREVIAEFGHLAEAIREG